MYKVLVTSKCWHHLPSAHGIWEVLPACLLHRGSAEGRNMSPALTWGTCAANGIFPCLADLMCSLRKALCVGSRHAAYCSAFGREH